jgi:hypothetical protein
LIHATSWLGQSDDYGAQLRAIGADKYVDAWTWRRIGVTSDDQIDKADSLFNAGAEGKPLFNNEFEYFSPTSDDCFVNTAQSIMNWLAFENARTWYWLHALKPTYNSEASGYSLGFWRPHDDDDFTKFPQIKKGHWDYNQQNFNAIAGFLKYMPWNSQRLKVQEDVVRKINRILAFTTPQGRLVIMLSNRTHSPYTFNVSVARETIFDARLYTPAKRDIEIGKVNGPTLSQVVPAESVVFLVQ